MKVELPYEIPYHDVDAMEIVWHGRHAKYFELARCRLLDRIDYGYKAMRESGYAWPIIDMRIQYVKPLTFGQQVILQAELKEWEYRLLIKYRIHDAVSGERLTKGYTSQVAVDLNTETMCFESPPILEQKLRQHQVL